MEETRKCIQMRLFDRLESVDCIIESSDKILSINGSGGNESLTERRMSKIKHSEIAMFSKLNQRLDEAEPPDVQG
jgi:hypothetical protein